MIIIINSNSFNLKTKYNYNYIKNTLYPKMTYNGCKFMKSLIILLKINIEYYMHEISYLLNDLYKLREDIL